MTAFPVLQRFEVMDYGLYPGTSARQGLQVNFQPGITLVLGANGLGKTTLVSQLFRMCTGPFDIPGLSTGGDLGSRRLDAKALPPRDRRVFGARVADGAIRATATLEFKVGATEIQLMRRLSDLALQQFTVNGIEQSLSESEYQQAVCKAAAVPSFGDWILLLRYLVFYLEDRRSLVWDPSAQRQMLRFLFLPVETSREWTSRERVILELDSRTRNVEAAIFGQDFALSRQESALLDRVDLQTELKTLEELQRVDQELLSELEDALPSSDTDRQNARLRNMQCEQNREQAYRNLERQQLGLIEAAFPTKDQSARYILARLISDDLCVVCGSEVPEVAHTMVTRINEKMCVLCASPVTEVRGSRSAIKRSLDRSAVALRAAEVELAAAIQQRQEAESSYDELVTRLQEMNVAVAKRVARIRDITNRLPPAEQALHDQRDALSALRAQIAVQKKELILLRDEFSKFIRGVNDRVGRRRASIKDAFDKYATDFLFEDCDLVWSPQRAKIGQTGESIPYPAFQLQMSGSNFSSTVRREGPGQVSESQREFVDLAFRMALMAVAGTPVGGSLVIDAPESSLDAVFVKRAAKVLAGFAMDSDAVENRLLITSNLIEGDLIPQLVNLSGIGSEKDDRVVDLLTIATPTAATRALKQEYADVRKRLFNKSGKTS